MWEWVSVLKKVVIRTPSTRPPCPSRSYAVIPSSWAAASTADTLPLRLRSCPHLHWLRIRFLSRSLWGWCPLSCDQTGPHRDNRSGDCRCRCCRSHLRWLNTPWEASRVNSWFLDRAVRGPLTRAEGRSDQSWPPFWRVCSIPATVRWGWAL